MLVAAPGAAQLKSDEHAILFNTAAWFDEPKDTWRVPVHGWVFELESSVIRQGAVKKLLQSRYGVVVSPENETHFRDRLDYLLADDERGKLFRVNVASQDIATSPSQANGHFEGETQFASASFPPGKSPAWLTAQLLTGDSRQIIGKVRLIPPQGVSVISDIDDTVKITEVLDRARLVENSLVKPFTAVPGMAELYRNWEARGAILHFLSASPWQLYPALQNFLREAGFPEAVLHLKSVRFTDATLFNLFENNFEFKRAAIVALLERYPKHRVILVGDDGEQDPEVYAWALKNYPEQIQRVYLRSVTGKPANDARFQALFQGVSSAKWRLFHDPAELEFL